MAVNKSNAPVSPIERALAGNSRRASTSQPAESAINKADVYANFGVQIGEEFVQLPYGLGIDNMNELSLKGSNEEYLERASKSNALLRKIQMLGETLAPGEEREIPMIVVIRRVKDDLAVPALSKEVDDQMDALFKDFM